jgi:hypothetical protein
LAHSFRDVSQMFLSHITLGMWWHSILYQECVVEEVSHLIVMRKREREREKERERERNSMSSSRACSQLPSFYQLGSTSQRYHHYHHLPIVPQAGNFQGTPAVLNIFKFWLPFQRSSALAQRRGSNGSKSQFVWWGGLRYLGV